MKYLIAVMHLTLAMAVITGCVAQRERAETQAEVYALHSFSAPLDQELSVNTGEAIFVEGRYIEGEYIDLPQSIDMMIPGSLMIPFPVHIDSGRIELTKIRGDWKYYCADEGRAAASFPGLGSVIRQGDCVGIRVSSNAARKEWVVDNSNYNRMNTVWYKSLNQDERTKYSPVASSKPFKIQGLRRIVFDGYYGSQLHFTWEGESTRFRESKEFVFDFAGRPTILGIKGNQFEVVAANNVRLRYKWLTLK
jgi:hypothetical protein